MSEEIKKKIIQLDDQIHALYKKREAIADSERQKVQSQIDVLYAEKRGYEKALEESIARQFVKLQDVSAVASEMIQVVSQVKDYEEKLAAGKINCAAIRGALDSKKTPEQLKKGMQKFWDEKCKGK
jgi:predicted methyltransferase MtxX (methanogen marker protein 4)